MYRLLDRISPNPIKSISDVVSNERLSKYLWVEFLISPDVVREFRETMGNPTVHDAIVKALSWYRAYSYLFATGNADLESLAEENRIAPLRIGWKEYRENIKSFLKGLQCLNLL